VLFTHGFATAAFPGWTGTSTWASVAEGAIGAFLLVLVQRMMEVLASEGLYEDERSAL
jgi:hypothetical protein